MSQGDEYKATEFYDPRAQGLGERGADRQPVGMPGWPGMQPVRGQSRTEVLRPKGPRVFALLVVVEGPGEGQIFRLNPSEPNTLGRDFTCDVVVDEPAVSRQHARLRLEQIESGESQYFIQDLATENGTQVNGEPVLKRYLTDGDRILVGRSVLVFKQA